ncbi:hypothetical protein, partial [Oleiphilus sp. HI0132]|uniref:hypothetical protein n=1 Tax=Oleiphilus sp. HI0132 TaxID=1822270 RepID=UPI000AD1E44E
TNVKVRNTSPDAVGCDSLLKAENIDFFRALIKERSLKYAIKDFFLFSGVGSDGWDQYPNIEVSNICDFSKKLPVTQILKSGQQIFQMEIQGNRLYVMANYDSREYAKYGRDIEFRAVLQIIDIENIENIKVLGETVIEGLVPRFTVDHKYAYIANDDDIMILDVSNPRDIKAHEHIKVTFDAFSSDDIAVIGSHIFVTGNNVLKVIDRETTKLSQEIEFDFRTSDIVVHNNRIFIRGWRNGWGNSRSRIAILEFNQGRAKLRSIVETGERISGLKLIDSYLVGRQGKA